MLLPSDIPPRGAGTPSGCPSHELRFVSLFHPGRGVSVPCDASGCVDLDGLTEKLRNAYLGARALVGREYATPQVLARH